MGKICEFVRVAAESLSCDGEYRGEEDVEQQRGKYASSMKPLCHLKPLRAYAVLISNASFHSIVELAECFYHLWWYFEASEHLPKKCAIDRVVGVDETRD